MRWIVVDSLYNNEARWCGHLDSYSHYLREYGESVAEVNLGGGVEWDPEPDVAFVLDGYGLATPRPNVRRSALARVAIAQVAAVCNPMPWFVRRPDGTPAYDLVISSLRWMVDEARAAGCRAEYQPLAFDTRARVAGMGVARDLGTIFVGSLTANHVARVAAVSRGLEAGTLTVFPPTFGRAYFRLLARAKNVLNVHAEWAAGEENNMRIYEASGMGATPVDERGHAQMLAGDVYEADCYEHRIPQLVAWAREIYDAKGKR